MLSRYAPAGGLHEIYEVYHLGQLVHFGADTCNSFVYGQADAKENPVGFL